jgi:hypothetical protein
MVVKQGASMALALTLFVGPAGVASVQGAQAEPKAAAGQVSQPAPGQIAPGDQATRLTRVDPLRDAKVVNAQGEQIAGIGDLVMDQQGRPVYAVLTVGGIAGIGGDEILVPFRDVQFNRAQDNRWTATVRLSPEQLKQAPRLEGNARSLRDRAWLTKNDRFYRPDAGQPEAAPEAGSTEGASAVLFRANKLTDANLRGAGDEEIADVLDVVVDQDYNARYLLLGTGGVQGFGQDQLVIPFELVRLAYDQDNDRYTPVVNLTKERLQQAPRLGDQGFPALGKDDFRRRIREYFGGLISQPQP